MERIEATEELTESCSRYFARSMRWKNVDLKKFERFPPEVAAKLQRSLKAALGGLYIKEFFFFFF